MGGGLGGSPAFSWLTVWSPIGAGKRRARKRELPAASCQNNTHKRTASHHCDNRLNAWTTRTQMDIAH